MAGTVDGGRAAAATNKERYGSDYYAKIGAKGGKNGKTGGFYHSKVNGLNVHVEAGRKGGKISRRGKAKKEGIDVG